jgi:hypothetical protein
MLTNVLFGLSLEASKNIKLSLAAGYTGIWGEYGITGGELINRADQGYINKLKIVLANIEIDKVLGCDGLKAVIGRQFYGREDSTAIYFGVRHYQTLLNTLISSLDAISLNYKKDKVEASAIYANVDSTGRKDFILAGIEGKVSNIKDIIDLEAYLYNFRDVPASVTRVALNNYTLLGFKPAVHVKDFKGSIEFVRPFSGDRVFSNETESFDTLLIKIDASYNIKNISLTPRATFFMVDGKNNKTVYTAGNYVPGLVGCPSLVQNDDGFIRYENTRIINVGADYAYKNAVFSLDFLNYGLAAAPTGSDYSMNEIDITVSYQYDDNLSLFAGVGEAFGEGSSNNTIDFGSEASIQAGVSYKF